MLLLTKANANEHCRTCLKQLYDSTEIGTSGCPLDASESKNIHINICNDPELQQLICINVDGPSTSDSPNPVIHNFPENLCLPCYNKLYSFAVFRRRAQQSAEKLRIVFNGHGNIKVEINFDDSEEEPRKIEPVALVPRECKFQLHAATAESEETFFSAAAASLADVEFNEDTVDPFSPAPPSVSDSSDRDIAELAVLQKDVDRIGVGEKETGVNKAAEKPKTRKSPKVVNKDKHRCPQCNQGFAKSVELTDHVNQVHPVGSRPFFCDHCDRSYRDNRNLKEHIVQMHQDKIKEQENHFQCSECPRAFLDNSALKKHMGLHFTEKKTKVCGICSERFPVKKWLVDHLRTHTSDGRIPCAQCDKTYSRHQDLENHERSAHLKEKPHHCQICDKSFQNKQSFRFHNYRHSGKKPYLCDICGKDFRQRTAMKTHRLTHLKNDTAN
ncbi:zinc finger protein 391-like [Eurosta solidaginis]|uniref:zinc finger protein 391-like n=1 Tax=Eurosta solidaginis TaxID=178769 RepID=UPI003530827D